jgi:hypothetical protein
LTSELTIVSPDVKWVYEGREGKWVFQWLEKQGGDFPMLGKNIRKSSNDWKKKPADFPMFGRMT